MDIFSILTMLGGLALFLYGMDVLGKGLAKLSGGRLERILEKMTGSLIKAVLLGAGATAVIQSSSAITVMVVGFVNSGLMKLSQAVGVIMGANIGTTVTSWILSLTGIESENFFIKLLKPSSFSPVLAVIGVIFLMFAKSARKKDVGHILIGFAVLMFGMQTMTDAVKPLAEVPEIVNILLVFNKPLLGMLAGLILTAVVQSSSASIGILQSLCATGAISYGAAVPIIMGQNIGTCVTALLSGIGASKNARRAAFVHLYFNVIGTILFMGIFYGVQTFVHFSFVNEMANAAGIAVIHSVFNVTATLILLPFHSALEKLAVLTVRDSKEDMEAMQEEEEMLRGLALMDERFLTNPSLAVENSREAALMMAALSEKAMVLSMELLTEYDEHKAKQVKKLENSVDLYEDKLCNYLIRLSSLSLSKQDSMVLSMLLHSISDLERISDHGSNVANRAMEMQEKNLAFSKECQAELAVYSQAVKDILDMTMEAFGGSESIVLESTFYLQAFRTGNGLYQGTSAGNRAQELCRQVEPLREVINDLGRELKNRHVTRLLNGACEVEQGFALSDICIDYERVAGHCSNLAADILRLNAYVDGLHEYRMQVRDMGNAAFDEAYHRGQLLYKLP